MEIDSPMAKLGPVMTLEASDYALVKWLNMCSKIWLKVFNPDILEIRRNNMTREIVLEKQNLLFLYCSSESHCHIHSWYS